MPLRALLQFKHHSMGAFMDITEPTEEMVNAPRQFLVYCETPGRNLKDARLHMQRAGASIASWPDWAKSEYGHITKAGMAVIIWHMMEAART